MVGIHIPLSGPIIISCMFILMLAKSSATKFLSIVYYHSVYIHFLKFIFIFRTYVDDQEIMHITTPAQGFWNWAHFQGHNIWGNSHNAPFDHSVCYLHIHIFSKSYHFTILFQYFDDFYLTWLHNVTVVDTHTKQISTCLHTMTCVYTIVGFFFL